MQKTERPAFWSGGLCFSCTRCSDCCRLEPGFVFLSENDLKGLVNLLKMGYTKFTGVYCRWIPGEAGQERLSLKEKANFDCIFWNGGCTVYEARPLQCRAFPFWPGNLRSQEAWERVCYSCPGSGRGEWQPPARIEERLAEQQRAVMVTRSVME